jgi:electron transfer flavoprotein beta subunit
MDNFRETLEMEFPALVTVSMEKYLPRYTALAGLENAFAEGNISIYDADALGISDTATERQCSRTRVRTVYLRKAQKENVVLTGTAAAVVNEFLDKYENKISAAIGKTIEGKKSGNE